MVSGKAGSGAVGELDLLREVYLSNLKDGKASVSQIAKRLGKSPVSVRAALAAATASKLLAKRAGVRVDLTLQGRRRLKVVMVGGAFEIIHPGHIHAVTEAKGLGNTLIVVVATDESVVRNKGRPPATDQASRVALVSSLRQVDLALPGNKGSIYEILATIRPDVVALGYDQGHNAEEIVKEAGRRGVKIRASRLGSPIPNVKSSKILLSL